MKRILFLSLLLSSLILQPSAFPQGSLTPPGAPAPTMKTLDQIEARTPLAGGTSPLGVGSGSYYLTGDLNISTSANGITVSGSKVTIDLNGFALTGPGSGSGAGIYLNGGVSNVAISNGTIRNWGSDGINGAGNAKVRVENLRVLNNGGNGILADVNAEVLNCIAESNVDAGIKGLDNCIVKDSQAISTTGTNAPGISVGVASVVTGCVARGNSGDGIATGQGSTIRDCVAYTNTLNGISVGDDCTISACVAGSNASAGIRVTNGANITGCTASSNTGEGINAGNNPSISNCNASYNGGNGIAAGVVGKVSRCVVAGNGGNGIDVSDHALIDNCHANANGGPSRSAYGIYVTNFSIVRDCTGDFQGVGIYVSGGRNRIEANNLTRNFNGIKVNAAGNLIIRNSASGNTPNYVIVSSNRYGAIIDDTATGAPPAIGNGFASSANTTDPWANFSY